MTALSVEFEQPTARFSGERACRVGVFVGEPPLPETRRRTTQDGTGRPPQGSRLKSRPAGIAAAHLQAYFAGLPSSDAEVRSRNKESLP